MTVSVCCRRVDLASTLATKAFTGVLSCRVVCLAHSSFGCQNTTGVFKRAGCPFAATLCAVVVSTVNLFAPGFNGLQLPVIDCESWTHAESGAFAFVLFGTFWTTFCYFGGFSFLASVAVLSGAYALSFGGYDCSDVGHGGPPFTGLHVSG